MAAPASAANIWSQLTGDKTSDQRRTDNRPDSHLYFVGPRGTGKSTLLNKYIFPDKSENPKATEGLEYTYLRKPATNPTDRKELAHLWELSGSEDLTHSIWNTVEILGPDQIATAAVAVVVDLSVPSQAVQQAAKWLQMIKTQVQASCAWLDKQGSKLPEQLAQRAKRYIGSSHEDRNVIQHLGISMVLVAAKEDAFRDAGVEAHSTMAQALRYIAHTHGASLVYLGGLNPASGGGNKAAAQDRASLANFRAMLNHMLFLGLDKRMKLRMSPQLDPLKPLMIPFGTDRLADIGMPKGMAQTQPGNPMALDQWLMACSRAFPPKSPSTKLQPTSDLEQYTEPEIDAARKQFEAKFAALRPQHPPQAGVPLSAERNLRRSTGSRKVL